MAGSVFDGGMLNPAIVTASRSSGNKSNGIMDWLPSLLSVLFGFGGSYVDNYFANRQMNKQNEFNANQAAINRDFQERMLGQQNAFNASEAEKSRQFAAQQDNTLYQRRVADMKAAGVNPALVMGGSVPGASTSAPVASGGTSPSGSQASSAGFAPTLSSMLEYGHLALQAKQVDSLVSRNDAAAKKDLADAGYTSLVADLYKPLTEENMKLMKAQARSASARADLDSANAVLSQIDSEKRSQLQDLQLRLGLSEIQRNNAQSAEIRQNIKNLIAQEYILHVEKMNAKTQGDILKSTASLTEYANKNKQFNQWYSAFNSLVGNVFSGIGAVKGTGAMPTYAKISR